MLRTDYLLIATLLNIDQLLSSSSGAPTHPPTSAPTYTILPGDGLLLLLHLMLSLL